MVCRFLAVRPPFVILVSEITLQSSRCAEAVAAGAGRGSDRGERLEDCGAGEITLDELLRIR
jgi:hypothetical protein